MRLALKRAGLGVTDVTGMVYNPLADEWRLARDTDVNYFVAARPGG
jgi:2-polyprenyl-6-hydroxyphenyl methylase / 3-demethylubiquinone-9 3-methyltransferase